MNDHSAIFLSTRTTETVPTANLNCFNLRLLAFTHRTFNRYANRANLFSQHGQFKLSLEAATAIVDQLQQVVAERWHATLRQHGTTLADCDKLAGAFNYPGFEPNPTVVLGGQP